MFRGIVSGLAATTAMSALLLAADRLGGVDEPPPQKVTRAALPALEEEYVPGTASVAHYGIGLAGAAAYALWPRRVRGVGTGILHGLAIWAVAYELLLPRAGVLPPAHRDKPGRAVTMILAHVVYGGVLGSVRRALDNRKPDNRKSDARAARRAAAGEASAGIDDAPATPDETWSVARLRLLASSREIAGASRMTKPELLAALDD